MEEGQRGNKTKTCSYVLALAFCAPACVVLDYNLSFYEPRVLPLLSMASSVPRQSSGRPTSQTPMCTVPVARFGDRVTQFINDSPGTKKRKCVCERTQRSVKIFFLSFR